MQKSGSYAKTPTVFQMEATECGAACLAMVLGYYGKYLPLERLRIETGVSRDGCNMENIAIAAEKFGLEVQGYKQDLEGLFKMPVPCIIHWNFNHFVVWEGRKGKYCYINDPGMGRRKLTEQEIDECFTGVVLAVQKTDSFEKSNEKETLLSFVRQRLKGQYGAIAALIVLGLFLVIPGLVIPAFSSIFIDDILLGGNYSWITALLAAMLFTFLFKMGLTYYRSVLLKKLTEKMTLISNYKFFSHMLKLPISFFDQRYAGDLAQRVSNDNNVTMFLTGTLAETILNCIIALFYLIMLIAYSPVLTMIGVINVVLNLILIKAAAGAMADISMRSQQESGKLYGLLISGLRLTSTLKASGTENSFVSRIQGNYAKGINVEQEMGMKQEALNAIPEVSSQILSTLLLIVGGLYVINGDMTAGMLVAFMALMDSFTAPINSLAGFITSIQTTKADMARVNDIMKYQEDPKFEERKYEKISDKLSGNVTVKDISFGYIILSPPLIESFGFDLKSGSSVAFVGASGSGKSTVSKICSGLYRPWSGEVLFDGVSREKIPPEVISASVSTVSQDITIFSGTIRDNLTMWNPYILEEDMVRAARDACIHDYIISKPEAYDYKLSEGGDNLSGGQRQRLEIARALVNNPSILIMDEATSALDPITEKKIIDNIKERGCTCIIVAHRLSAIRDCDEILVMDKGKIVQRGSHEELSKVEGHYQRLIKNI